MVWNETIRQSILRRLSGYRYTHTIGVEKAAIKLAENYGCDIDKCAMAACLHDITKRFSKEEQLYLCEKYDIIVSGIEKIEWKMLHGKTAAEIARFEYGAPDDVVSAVACHTTGKASMNLMDKIIYLADYIEENRKFDGVDIARRLADESIDKALLYCFDTTIEELISREKTINMNTMVARNELIENGISWRLLKVGR